MKRRSFLKQAFMATAYFAVVPTLIKAIPATLPKPIQRVLPTRLIYASDYGVVADGRDCTANLKLAIDAARPGGAAVVLPAGRIRVY